MSDIEVVNTNIENSGDASVNIETPISQQSKPSQTRTPRAMYGVVNLIGRSSEGGGEIFNDYINNKAYGEYSAAFGTNNIVGSKYFDLPAQTIVTSTNEQNQKIYTIQINGSLTQEEVPSEAKAVLRFGSWYYCENIQINNNDETITSISFMCPYGGPDGKSIEDTEEVKNVTNSVFCLIDNYNLGTKYLGSSAFSGGNNNIVANEGAVAFGEANKAYGNNSVAIGRENFVVYQGIALGRGNQAYKETGIGIGVENIIENQVGVGIGRKNQVLGQFSVAIGNSNIVREQAGLAIGDGCVTDTGGIFAIGKHALSNATTPIALNCNENKYYFEIGNQNHREYPQNYLGLDRNVLNLGFGNIAVINDNYSRYNIVAGNENKNLGSGNVVIGHKNEAGAESEYSFIFGENLTTSSSNVFLMGVAAKADSNHAISIGYYTSASGLGATAMGWENYTKANFSSAFGKRNIASASSQFVVGEANAQNDEALFIVGNGKSDDSTIGEFGANDKRSNAFWVNKDGTIETSRVMELKDYPFDNFNRNYFPTMQLVDAYISSIINTTSGNSPSAGVNVNNISQLANAMNLIWNGNTGAEATKKIVKYLYYDTDNVVQEGSCEIEAGFGGIASIYEEVTNGQSVQYLWNQIKSLDGFNASIQGLAANPIGNVTINGTTTLNDNLTIASGKTATFGGNVIIDGTTNFKNDLIIETGKTATFGGSVVLNNGLTVASGKTATFGGNVTINGTTNLKNDLTIETGKKATFGGETEFNGNITLGDSALTSLKQNLSLRQVFFDNVNQPLGQNNTASVNKALFQKYNIFEIEVKGLKHNCLVSRTSGEGTTHLRGINGGASDEGEIVYLVLDIQYIPGAENATTGTLKVLQSFYYKPYKRAGGKETIRTNIERKNVSVTKIHGIA